MANYDAFLSHSHAKDKPIAGMLQSVVQKRQMSPIWGIRFNADTNSGARRTAIR
jgi:hypothetical protein